jgi:hypothetical protein
VLRWTWEPPGGLGLLLGGGSPPLGEQLFHGGAGRGLPPGAPETSEEPSTIFEDDAAWGLDVCDQLGAGLDAERAPQLGGDDDATAFLDDEAVRVGP